MSLRTDLALRTEQRLALAPRMLQSIEILQLATAELAERIAAEIESNEVLDVVAEGRESASLDAVDKRAELEAARLRADAEADFVAAQFGDGDRHRGLASGGGDEAGDRRRALLDAIPARGHDLRSHVEEQLDLEGVVGAVRDKVMALTDLLDEHGYLDADDIELAARLGGEGLDEARHMLAALEPRGLGTRGPLDAMLAQIGPSDPDRPAIEAILNQHLQALAARRENQVAAELQIDLDELHMLLDRIARLEARPADLLLAGGAPAVQPDVVVRRLDDGSHEVVVDDVALPVLGVNDDYARMAEAEDVDGAVRRYLRKKLRAAHDLIDAVRHRRETLARVAAEVFAEQAGFLRQGRTAIRPLRMSDIAERLDLHTSTISRAVAGKWVETDFGVCPLRDFFDGARGAAAHPGQGGRAVGRSAVQERVRELIVGEDRRAPLSDDDLVRRLGESGVRVARRTVAKYRGELGIPSSWQRRDPAPGEAR